jgi:hypothetical protein
MVKRKQTLPRHEGVHDPYQPAAWEKIVASVAALCVIGLAIFVVVRNERFADANIVVVLRIALSFSVATLGATVPGFLHVSWHWKGTAIRAAGALALFVLTYLFTPTIVPAPTPSPQNSERPHVASLVLRMDDGPPDENQTKGMKSGLGQLVSFTLSNPLNGTAVVDDVALEVFDDIPDECGSIQTIVHPYNYTVELEPGKRGRMPFTPEKFKYSHGEIDHFYVRVVAGLGSDYIARVSVRWHDDLTGVKFEASSDLQVVSFPAPAPLGLPAAEREDRYKRRNALLEDRMNKAKASLRKT